ncbi:MAG: DUF3575 domain-containing protein [Candidatus Cryptobacteroides sp.]
MGGGENSNKSDGLHGLDRWSFRVNFIELLCTVPNFSAEFDLSTSQYSRSTVSLGVKYNWNTWHTLPSNQVFNMFEVRPEYRWWFRIKDSKSKLISKEWLGKTAFFAGAYMQGGTYSIKPGTYGIQGPLFGAGASFGFDMPMYSYRKFALDFELGIAAGFLITKLTTYTLSRSGSDYVSVPEKSKAMHFVPYPVFTELKACFVFRSMSIQEKYRKEDHEKIIKRQERKDAREAAKLEKKEKLAQAKAEKAEAKEKIKAEAKTKAAAKADAKAKAKAEKAKAAKPEKKSEKRVRKEGKK